MKRVLAIVRAVAEATRTKHLQHAPGCAKEEDDRDRFHQRLHHPAGKESIT